MRSFKRYYTNINIAQMRRIKPHFFPLAAPLGRRVFSWFGRNRRLAKEAFVALASIQIAIRRLAGSIINADVTNYVAVPITGFHKETQRLSGS